MSRSAREVAEVRMDKVRPSLWRRARVNFILFIYSFFLVASAVSREAIDCAFKTGVIKNKDEEATFNLSRRWCHAGGTSLAWIAT
jgi:hypothetical protein